MGEVQRIQDQLKRAHEGIAWHGPGVMEVLKGVTFEKALARPIAGAHTIWELALHINAWQKAVRRRLDGGSVELSDAEDWPTRDQQTESGWNEAVADLVQGYERVQEGIGRLTDEDLKQEASGEKYTIYYMLHGLIQHNLFHAGQISLLKK